MSRTYIVLAVVLIGLAGGLLLLSENVPSKEISPELLLKEMNDPARYITVDRVADRLIKEDPALLLVDVRPSEETTEYTLPGALSIPLSDLLQPEWQDYLDQDAMDVVFFSNGDVFADQAWIFCKRKGYDNIYVMTGGLNRWFTTIMQPTPPDETAPSEAFDRYAFRRGAAMFFSGGGMETGTTNTEANPVILNKRKKKTVAEGGC
jgi:rhodanese-related sulfurtransferase